MNAQQLIALIEDKVGPDPSGEVIKAAELIDTLKTLDLNHLPDQLQAVTALAHLLRQASDAGYIAALETLKSEMEKHA